MRFQHPDYFVFLLAVPFLLLLLRVWQQWRQYAAAQLGDEKSLKALLPAISPRRFWSVQFFLAAALALLILALANPLSTGMEAQPKEEGSDVILILDISNSMLTEDVKPNRLGLAQRFAARLVKTLEGERIGLIFFAGSAFLQVPLSTDYGFLLQSLQSASPDLLTTQGTAISEAVRLAQTTFDKESRAGRALIIITDGENHDEEAVESVEKAFSEYGIVTFAIGAGTDTGGPIPVGEADAGAYKRDENGTLVRSRLNQNLLREIARAGNTQTAFNLRQSDEATEEIRKAVEGLAKQQIVIPVAALLQTRYQWLLGAAIFCLWIYYMMRNRGISSKTK